MNQHLFTIIVLGKSIVRYDFEGTVYEMKPGPKATATHPIKGLTVEELAILERASKGVRLVRRIVGTCSYLMIR